MAQNADCLIIVQRDRPELCEKLKRELAQHANVEVRLDGRRAEASVQGAEVFERRPLPSAFRAYVQAQIRLLAST